MLFREMIAFYFDNHLKHTNSVGRTQSFDMLNQVVHAVNTGLQMFNPTFWTKHINI
jgi:hypothetical protein